jgi:hypothetical protein
MNKFKSVDVPQANTLRLVASLTALAAHGYKTKRLLSEELPLVEREVEYYMQAARILGFADYDQKNGISFALTKQAHQFLAKVRPHERKAMLARAVRRAPVIAALLTRHRETGLNVEKVANFLREVTEPRLQRNTARRRANTIIRWLEWTRE